MESATTELELQSHTFSCSPVLAENPHCMDMSGVCVRKVFMC